MSSPNDQAPVVRLLHVTIDAKGHTLTHRCETAPLYFSRAFKRHTGSSPTQYREGVEEKIAFLGCGMQIGAGSIFKELRPQSGSSIATAGTGGVGLAAVMAAAHRAARRSSRSTGTRTDSPSHRRSELRVASTVRPRTLRTSCCGSPVAGASTSS